MDDGGTRPSPAGICDYLLGGDRHLAVDRAAAEDMLAAAPGVRALAAANRDFVRGAVGFARGCGVGQILHLGCGMPSAPAVHDLAPHARVVYVDREPVAVDAVGAATAGLDRVAVVHADITGIDAVCDTTAMQLDLTAPVLVIAAPVFHFIGDDDAPAALTATLRARLPAGSMLAVSHGSSTIADLPDTRIVLDVYARAGHPIRLRSPARIRELFGDWPLTGHGLTPAPGVGWSGPASRDGPRAGALLCGVAVAEYPPSTR